MKEWYDASHTDSIWWEAKTCSGCGVKVDRSKRLPIFVNSAKGFRLNKLVCKKCYEENRKKC